MKIKLTAVMSLLLCLTQVSAQHADPDANPSGNNLVLPSDYVTSEYGAIPQYIKTGNGKQTMLLIPGWGFDASVFTDFMEAHKKEYTMYAVTIPGFGNTKAPPMPPAGTSYGEQSWNRGAGEGLVRLIEKEKLQRPVIVGHFTQGTQLALRLAVDHPDKVGGVIILGGCAKFISVMGDKTTEYPLDTMIYYVDRYTAPAWFKPISKKFFDANNYLPEIYSIDSAKAATLWKQSAAVPLPVMVRYICEFFASDIKKELHRIKCPVLILRPLFNEKVLQSTTNNYIKPQFIDAWQDAPALNPLIEVKDIASAAGFVWKDKPVETSLLIKEFLKRIRQ